MSGAAPNQAQQNTLHALNLAAQLVAGGVRDAVISPGSRSTPLVFAFDAYEKLGAIRTHIVLDERVAGFVALGLARRSGRPVALACTSGSAGAHYLPAMIEATHAGLCLIALTADRPEELYDRGAPQTMEQRGLFGAFAPGALHLSAPAPGLDLRREDALAIQHALQKARAGSQPLHINVALREPLWDASCEALLAAPPAPRDLRIAPATPTLSDNAHALLDAPHGRAILYVGPIDAGRLPGAARARFQQQLQALSEQRAWPIFADAVSPLRARTHAVVHHADLLLRDDHFFHAGNVDTVFVLGPWPTSKPFGQWLTRHPSVRVLSLPGAPKVVDPWHRVDAVVGGPLGALVEAMALRPPSPAASDAPPLRPLALQLDEAADNAIDEFCDEHPTFEGSAARAVLDAIEGDASVHIGASMPIRDVDAYSRGAGAAVQLCASRGMNGIDGNISTALGAALADDTPAVLLHGDLAFRHDVGGLLHAANTDAKLTVVVVDNAGGGIFRQLAVRDSGDKFARYFLTPQQSELAQIATGCGSRAHVVAGAAELAAEVRASLHRRGCDVIILRVNGEAQPSFREAAVAAATEAARAALLHIQPTRSHETP